MEKEKKTIKRTIRMPVELHEVLEEESRRRGKYVNQVIMEVLRKGVWNRSRRDKERKKMVLICVFMGKKR